MTNLLLLRFDIKPFFFLWLSPLQHRQETQSLGDTGTKRQQVPESQISTFAGTGSPSVTAQALKYKAEAQEPPLIISKVE